MWEYMIAFLQVAMLSFIKQQKFPEMFPSLSNTEYLMFSREIKAKFHLCLQSLGKLPFSKLIMKLSLILREACNDIVLHSSVFLNFQSLINFPFDM